MKWIKIFEEYNSEISIELANNLFLLFIEHIFSTKEVVKTAESHFLEIICELLPSLKRKKTTKRNPSSKWTEDDEMEVREELVLNSGATFAFFEDYGDIIEFEITSKGLCLIHKKLEQISPPLTKIPLNSSYGTIMKRGTFIQILHMLIRFLFIKYFPEYPALTDTKINEFILLSLGKSGNRKQHHPNFDFDLSKRFMQMKC